MFEAIGELDAAAALAEAADLRRGADRAEARLLAVAAHWADLHVVPAGEGVRHPVPGMEVLVPLAGEGTPEVAEFAPAELGAVLGMSTHAAGCFVGDALELRHRLPRLWGRVMAGDLQAWRARRVAEQTRVLSPAAAAWVDAQVAPFAHKIGLGRVLAAVQAALVRFDPEEAARREKATADGRGVYLGEETIHGRRSIQIEADAVDAAAFDATIDAIAGALGAAGDADRVQVRRAKAVGVIADPQGTLDLLDHPASDGAADDTTGSTSDGIGPFRRGRMRWGRGKPVLYLHLHADAVTGHGVARVEGDSPVSVEQLRTWLGATEMTIQPVIDLNQRISVDAYETPQRISEVLYLRNPCCPFPWCTNTSRRKDTDHIEPYLPPEDGGPPGQTNTDNTAPLCRRHHRLKTHGGWSYVMPEPGIYLWRSPTGQRFLVDHTGTTHLHQSA